MQFELLGGDKKDAGCDGSAMSNARLAILPGLTHYNIYSSPALAPTITPFLNAPMPGASQSVVSKVAQRDQQYQYKDRSSCDS